jgi:Ca-activated chloride channel family protein
VRRTGCSMRSVSICRSRVRWWAASTLVVVMTGAVCAAQTVFRSQIDLVALQVTVVDDRGHYVRDLQAEDFAVFEEGVPQPISVFAAATAPVDLMLLIDTSGSMINRISSVKRAAINFVHALQPDDRAAVVLFNHRIRVVQKLTEDRAKLTLAIERASTAGQTALHDALYVALKELTHRRRDQQPWRRQALVVLTDGDDTASHVSIEDVFAIARRHTVTVYTVAPPETRAFPPEEASTSPLFDMRKLAGETGGRTFVPERMEELRTVYGEIARELSHQYWLAYAPPPAPAAFRRVSVRIVNRDGMQVRTRTGYQPAGRALVTPDASREQP